MELARLIEGLAIRVLSGDPRGVRVCDLTEDSRTVVPGSLFIARRGTAADGKRFAQDAVEAGACAVMVDEAVDPEGVVPAGGGAVVLLAEDAPRTIARLSERFFGEPASRLAMVGVTGTNGKSTIAHLVHRLARAQLVRCGLIGTVEIDDGREVAHASLTTPPAIELSRTLAQMVEHGCHACVMEASSHALVQGRAAGPSFRAAVFTNLTGDHLDYHGTMDEYAAAKAILFEGLATDAIAVVNADSAWCERMVRDCRARIVRCAREDGENARGGDATWRIVGLVTTPGEEGMELCLRGAWGERTLRTRLVGEHNAVNLLQAMCVAHDLAPEIGLDREELWRSAARVGAPAGRLEGVSGPGDDVAVYVDYAHTDDALANVLRSVRPLAGARGAPLCVVFGCGGDRDRTKRPRMGRVASELADRAVVTSDNPRSEPPSRIISEVVAGIDASRRDRIAVHADRAHAIREAIMGARAGEVIVIAGKGHETEQLFIDASGVMARIHFDDREVAREALRERRGVDDGGRGGTHGSGRARGAMVAEPLS
ncbi:MAG: UDP-N-acetylmuramoyl-L-alanyl-D-glutamate--2,6-diaminopimelate ligase [Phycisphaerales bacterium]|jgi:UDP-N-acetylmuramoyl-L-alanyl-D-glutamate--2,6-diaminopimelate ligase|nr:UDP-N-acetylmuramoyl-L-alanyl-D-glutamate--2,6-diaminopimelate ligase [Phycisphaerales bacterium]